MDGSKTCTKCKEVKLLNEFYGNKRATDGLTSWCKLCTNGLYKNNPEYREKARERYRKNREYQIDKQMERYWANRDKYLAQQRDRYNELIKDPEFKKRERDRLRNYRENNRDEINKKSRERYRKDKKYRASRKMEARNRQRLYQQDQNIRFIKNEKQKRVKKLEVASLGSNYIKGLIRDQSNGVLTAREIPKRIISLKRQSLRLKRLIKQKKNA